MARLIISKNGIVSCGVDVPGLEVFYQICICVGDSRRLRMEDPHSWYTIWDCRWDEQTIIGTTVPDDPDRTEKIRDILH